MNSTKNIFAIYANEDKDVLPSLLLHLKPLEKDFNIAIWSDDVINRGQPWTPRNVSRLNHADVFLFLLSNTFMYSEFIKQDEFKMVVDRYKEGKAIIIPLVLDDCPWNVEFTFNDYNFNFSELLVFHKDEKQIDDWNPTDKTFTQVAYYVRGLLASSTKKRDLEESAKRGGKKILNTKKEEQIVIDFFEEAEVNNNEEKERKVKKETETKIRVEENSTFSEEAEATEAKEVIRKEKRLRQKAEIQKRIEKEKSLKEKAKKGKKIEEGIEVKRVVQEEIRGNEEAKAQMAAEEKRRGEITQLQRETEREKRREEIVAVQKKVTKKNGLSRYNYQFKTAKVVEAKRVVQEERRGNEEAKAQMVLEEKRRGEITQLQRETEREKGPGEILAAQKKVTKKNGLAEYNYQFKTAKTIEAKKVVQEKMRGNEEAKARMVLEEKRRVKISKSQRKAEREKRLEEIVSALKRVMKKNRSAVQKYHVISATAVNQIFNEAKAKVAVEEKRLGELVKELKRFFIKNRLFLKNYQVKNTKAINQFLKKEKRKISTEKKRRVRPEFLIAALVIFGILIYVFTGDSEKQSTTPSEIEHVEVASDAGVNTKTNPENQEAAAILKLGVGDIYKGGIIFAIDPSNKTGKIASMDDEGPMTWKDAMTIHEQLGEGWRLPTLDELRLMYNNIGQGADNRGEFADELYWSATPFDDYQARLLRFSDGNASYHFNSVGTYRKFRVRAIQDFKR
ncbi:TIR domain-containing protein [Pricia antarctica]|uniref:TIR domain-containing protein n=1 Tax=Pricia antarctica TaxID=641691 RepID=A0A1G7FXI6_9FLAO|nr:TIR domain-containing protein [Pricia antarctica]SDE80590.1 TIR domain-containing protein [Pricia antarctica]